MKALLRILFAASILLGSCNFAPGGGGPAAPQAWIDQPLEGSRFLLGDTISIQWHATGDDGVCQRPLPRAGAVSAPAGALRSGADPLADSGTPILDVTNVSVLALADGHVASSVVSLDGLNVAPALADRGYLYTDRPAYRAGQQVFVRGCIRSVKQDAYAVEAGKEYTLDVLDPRNRLVWQQPLALGKFGTLAADFPLPPIGVPAEA